jgi:hypothetical protein
MSITDHVALIEAKDVLRQLDADLASEPAVKLWCYSVEPQFFESHFLAPRPNGTTDVILDYRQRDRLQGFLATHPNLRLRSWVKNRTQHDKTLICVHQRVVWITTHNLHRGSFMLARNRALRTTLDSVFDRCFQHFLDDWKISNPLEG